MFRGILSTIYVESKNKKSIYDVYRELINFYRGKKFIIIKKIDSMLSTNNVINTNNIQISVCKTKFNNKFIILSVIDNLIKGGAGQAVQNMNIKFNFKINEGLKWIKLST